MVTLRAAGPGSIARSVGASWRYRPEFWVDLLMLTASVPALLCAGMLWEVPGGVAGLVPVTARVRWRVWILVPLLFVGAYVAARTGAMPLPVGIIFAVVCGLGVAVAANLAVVDLTRSHWLGIPRRFRGTVREWYAEEWHEPGSVVVGIGFFGRPGVTHTAGPAILEWLRAGDRSLVLYGRPHLLEAAYLPAAAAAGAQVTLLAGDSSIGVYVVTG